MTRDASPEREMPRVVAPLARCALGSLFTLWVSSRRRADCDEVKRPKLQGSTSRRTSQIGIADRPPSQSARRIRVISSRPKSPSAFLHQQSVFRAARRIPPHTASTPSNPRTMSALTMSSSLVKVAVPTLGGRRTVARRAAVKVNAGNVWPVRVPNVLAPPRRSRRASTTDARPRAVVPSLTPSSAPARHLSTPGARHVPRRPRRGHRVPSRQRRRAQHVQSG